MAGEMKNSVNRLPREPDVAEWTDHYFNRSKGIVQKFGDQVVTYAIFMRRPVVATPRLMIDWLQEIAKARGVDFEIDLIYEEGEWVGAGEPILYLSGSFENLVDLETIFLQKLGAACVAAYNAYTMCTELPKVAFLAFDARHDAGIGMAELMAYAASVGSERAKAESGATGFVGNATAATAHFLINRTASEPCHMRLLGMSDPLYVRRRCITRHIPPTSYAVLERHVPDAIRGYRSDSELRHLVGVGVSAASIWRTREKLDDAGFEKVKIIGLSGFGPEKCRIMAIAKAPLDAVGTGSFLPTNWHETYVTADIIEYAGQQRVKLGREFLFRNKKEKPGG